MNERYDSSPSAEPVIIDPAGIGVMLRRRMLVTVLAALAIYMVIWGPDALDGLSRDLALVLGGYLAYLAGSAVHESVHLLGYVAFGGAPWGAVGISFRGLQARAQCAVPITVGALRAALVLPGIVLGVLPLLVGYENGLPWLTILGALMLAGSLGDVRVLLVVRHLRANTYVSLR
jgi:hypothetical protein